MSGDRRVWVVTDGRPGNAGPAGALARALQAHGWAAAERRDVVPKAWAARLPAGVWARLPFGPGGWPFSGYEGGAAALEGDWPGLVISAGRRSAPAAAAMRALSGGRVRAVQVLDPRMPATMFDALVTPAHDARGGANVIETLGSLSRVTPELAAEAARAWAARLAHLPRPRLAALIGGPSGAARWAPGDGARLGGALDGAGAEGWGVMATGSRRTPAAVLERLGGGYLWDGAGENPYPGILGLADAALVTGDSVNMASEAASAGAPAMLFEVGGMSRKLLRFHEELVRGGHARRYRGRIERWEVAPLREAERVAALLAERYLESTA